MPVVLLDLVGVAYHGFPVIWNSVPEGVSATSGSTGATGGACPERRGVTRSISCSMSQEQNCRLKKTLENLTRPEYRYAPV